MKLFLRALEKTPPLLFNIFASLVQKRNEKHKAAIVFAPFFHIFLAAKSGDTKQQRKEAILLFSDHKYIFSSSPFLMGMHEQPKYKELGRQIDGNWDAKFSLLPSWLLFRNVNPLTYVERLRFDTFFSTIAVV